MFLLHAGRLGPDLMRRIRVPGDLEEITARFTPLRADGALVGIPLPRPSNIRALAETRRG